jgi:putative flippase GtrA
MTFSSPEHLRIIRYGLVGVLGALMQITALWLWVDILGLREHYLWGVVVGFSLALAATFPLQKYWSFQDASHHAAPRQFISNTVIALCSVCLNLLFLSGAKMVLENMQVDFFHVWYVVAQAGIVVVIAGLSFVSNRFLTFKNVPSDNL